MKTVTREMQIRTTNLPLRKRTSTKVEANDAGRIPRAKGALRARRVVMPSPIENMGHGLIRASRMIRKGSPRRGERSVTARMTPKEAKENSHRRMMTLGILPGVATKIKDPEEEKEKGRVRKDPPHGHTMTIVQKKKRTTLLVCGKKWIKEEESKKRSLKTVETARIETAPKTKVVEIDSLAIALKLSLLEHGRVAGAEPCWQAQCFSPKLEKPRR